MNITGKMLSLLGASCLVAFATATPAEARPKPCCYNNGQFFESTPSTCYRYGGRVVNSDRCYRGYYDRGYYDRGYYDDGYYGRSRYRDDGDVTFSIGIGNIVFAYSDGYYDRHRRWHHWRDHRQRDWYRRHYGRRYHGYRRDDERDHRRRDWWRGRRDRWD